MELNKAENKREFKEIPEMNEAEIEISEWGYENGRTKVYKEERR
jgi:hypothetical protein